MPEKTTPKSIFMSFFAGIITGISYKVRKSRLVSDLKEGTGKSLLVSSGFADLVKYKIALPFKRRFAEMCDKSVILSRLTNLFENVVSLPVRIIGLMFFSYGIAGAGIYMAEKYLFSMDVSIYSLAFSIATAAFFGISMTSGKTVGQAVYSSRVLSAIFDGLFGKTYGGDEGPKEILPNGSAVFIGIFLACVSVFTSPLFGLLLPLFIYFCYCILSRPFIGEVLIIVLLPFTDAGELAFVTLVITLSTFFKVLRGKRNYTLSLAGVFLAAVACVMIMSGFMTGFAEVSAAVLAIINFANITALFKTDRGIGKLENALAVPGIVCAAAVITEYLISLVAQLLFSDYSVKILNCGKAVMILSFVISLPQLVIILVRGKSENSTVLSALGVAAVIVASYFTGGKTTLLIMLVFAFLSFAFISAEAGGILFLPFAAVFAFVYVRAHNPKSTAFIPDIIVSYLPSDILTVGGGSDGRFMLTELSGISVAELDSFSHIILSIGTIGLVFVLLFIGVNLLNSMKAFAIGMRNTDRRHSIEASFVSALGLFAYSFVYDFFGASSGIFGVLMIFGYMAASQRILEKYSAESGKNNLSEGFYEQ